MNGRAQPFRTAGGGAARCNRFFHSSSRPGLTCCGPPGLTQAGRMPALRCHPKAQCDSLTSEGKLNSGLLTWRKNLCNVDCLLT